MKFQIRSGLPPRSVSWSLGFGHRQKLPTRTPCGSRPIFHFSRVPIITTGFIGFLFDIRISSNNGFFCGVIPPHAAFAAGCSVRDLPRCEIMAVEATGTIQSTAMDISVSKFELLRELTATQGVVERKTTIPILSNFLFEAANDRLTITATDLDLSLRTSCAAKVKREGACTIPARKLYDYVKLLPDGDITIKLLENHWVNIRSGRSNTKMVGMARANFPTILVFE